MAQNDSELASAPRCGIRVFLATGAGVCFLVAATCFAGVGAFLVEVVDSPREGEWALLGTVAIVVGMVPGAVVFVYCGLSIVDDWLPRGRIAMRPLSYLLVLGMVLVLAVVAVPLVPITFAAAMIVSVAGPLLDRAITRRCADCVLTRAAQLGTIEGPVFCARHERFFGGDMYRALLRNDGD